MARIEAISGQTLRVESAPVAKQNAEQYEIGRELKGDVVAKADAERLKNVPKNVQEKYEEAKEIINAIEKEYDNFMKYPQCFEQGRTEKDGLMGYDVLRLSFSREKMLKHMSSFEKSTYLKYAKVVEDLEAQYPELNAYNYYTKIAHSSKEDIPPVSVQPEPSKVVTDVEMPSDNETPVANGNGIFKKALKFGVFGPIVAPLIPDKDEPLAKGLGKAPLGVLGWLLP